LNFVAIDVETANADMASICQIGVAKYIDGELVEEWSSLVDPEDYFDFVNIDIHGLTEDDVIGSPTFPEVVNLLGGFLNNSICVSHTHFDRVSVNRALAKYGLPEFDTIWLDSARVARRTWDEFAWSGYGLANVCEKIGYKFKHHDALEDAKASGQVLLAAIDATGLDVESWLNRINQPIDPNNVSSRVAIKRDGNPEGELYGEVLVFTGALEIPRREAADLAASIGCTVASRVTKKTSLLVVGDQDISKLAGVNKSSKHRKAESLIQKGQHIRIIKESDFKELVIVENGYWGKIVPRLQKTYLNKPGFVEIMFQVLGPKGEVEVDKYNPPLKEGGEHYTDYVERVKQLKFEERFEEAIPLLIKLIEETEKEAKDQGEGWGVAPWYYEQLAIIFRKLKQCEKEVEVLERYARQPKAPGSGPKKLAERLVKAREIFNRKRA